MNEKIEQWIDEIRRYNSRLHLVSPAMLADLPEHVQDCLELMADIDEPVMADLGSGSGLPAIPYKIQHPESDVFLIERSAKKCQFLRRVIAVLGLDGIEVIEGDPLVDDLGRFDAILSRAFSPKENLDRSLKNLITEEGTFYYMGNSSVAPVSEDFTRKSYVDVRSEYYLARYGFSRG